MCTHIRVYVHTLAPHPMLAVCQLTDVRGACAAGSGSNIYIHAYIHTYVCMYIHTLHTYIHTYMHIYIRKVYTYIHTYIRICVKSLSHS